MKNYGIYVEKIITYMQKAKENVMIRENYHNLGQENITFLTYWFSTN